MDENGLYKLLSHGWEVVAGVTSAALSYVLYSKRKKEEQLSRIEENVKENTLDNSVFKVEIREIKEDIREIKDWIFNNKKRK